MSDSRALDFHYLATYNTTTTEWTMVKLTVTHSSPPTVNMDLSDSVSSSQLITAPATSDPCRECEHRRKMDKKTKKKKNIKHKAEPESEIEILAEPLPAPPQASRHPIYYFEDPDIATVPIKVHARLMSLLNLY